MAESCYTHFTNTVDDLYFSALYEDEQLFPISDHKYAEELQFQEVLMSSALLASYSTLPKRIRHHHLEHAARRAISTIAGESSSSSSPSVERSFCDICADFKPEEAMFRTEFCPHSFCNDCVARHIAVKLQENITAVNCPAAGCRAVLDPPLCSRIIPDEVFQRWVDALCESVVLAATRFYCPYRDCSVFMVKDSGEVVREAECPSCRRLFCARCQVPWHAGVECEEFQRLREHEKGREDLMVMELAKRNEWKRCPKCRFYVEKTDGCLHISCRCGHHFCYSCGSAWGTGAHGGDCNSSS